MLPNTTFIESSAQRATRMIPTHGSLIDSAKPKVVELMFARRMADVMRHDLVRSSAITIAKSTNVYMAGELAQDIYLVERGQIKMHVIEADGRSCVLDIHAAGDVFGESCLPAPQARLETATAMRDSTVRKIPLRHILNGSGLGDLVLSLLKHLASRVYDQQRLIANLVIDDSEKRLAKTLLCIAHKHGVMTTKGTRVGVRLSHQDLSEMVGTTRPRISEFMEKFRQAECVLRDTDHHLLINEVKLNAYIMRPRGRPNHKLSTFMNPSFPAIRDCAGSPDNASL